MRRTHIKRRQNDHKGDDGSEYVYYTLYFSFGFKLITSFPLVSELALRNMWKK